jgi:hypothetical protein
MASSINIFHKIHTNCILRRTCVNYRYLYHAGSDPDQNLDPNKPLCTVSVVKILLMSFFLKSFGSRPNSGSESALTSCLKHPINNGEQPPVDDTAPNGPLDENRTFHNKNTNQTSLHVFNTLIRNLHNLHNEISKRKKNENNLKIRNISNSLRNLKHELENQRSAS